MVQRLILWVVQLIIMGDCFERIKSFVINTDAMFAQSITLEKIIKINHYRFFSKKQYRGSIWRFVCSMIY